MLFAYYTNKCAHTPSTTLIKGECEQQDGQMGLVAAAAKIRESDAVLHIVFPFVIVPCVCTL